MKLFILAGGFDARGGGGLEADQLLQLLHPVPAFPALAPLADPVPVPLLLLAALSNHPSLNAAAALAADGLIADPIAPQ